MSTIRYRERKSLKLLNKQLGLNKPSRIKIYADWASSTLRDFFKENNGDYNVNHLLSREEISKAVR